MDAIKINLSPAVDSIRGEYMAFTFSPSMPDFAAKDAARVYQVGKYHALLVVSAPMAAVKLDPNIDKDLPD
jgi:hypothetical protein